MAPAKPAPLGRSATRDVLDWDEIEPRLDAPTRDVFGFKDEDRVALGMGLARPVDIAPTLAGDAHAALIEALAKGAAIQATKKRAR